MVYLEVMIHGSSDFILNENSELYFQEISFVYVKQQIIKFEQKTIKCPGFLSYHLPSLPLRRRNENYVFLPTRL